MRLWKLTYYEAGGGFGFHWFKFKREALAEQRLTVNLWLTCSIEPIDFRVTREGIIGLLRQHTPVRNQ